jgi:putative methionine-R-sulfoxide reductase with GAF domain
MFELLTRQKSIRNSPVENSELLLVKNVEPLENTREQMIETFIKRSTYHGKSLMQYSLNLLSSLAREKEISQGVFFIVEKKKGNPVLKFLSGYAFQNPENMEEILEFGEGFPGQVAKDGNLINISDIPEGYITIETGLGKASPVSLIIFPIKHNNNVLAVIELASFHKFTREDELFFEGISKAIGEQIINCIAKS